MAELTASQKARLGLFVVLGLALLLGALGVLAGLRLAEKRDIYTVRYADSVSGLEVNATVKYRGLRIGRVDALRIDPDDPNLIAVTISIEPGTKLYQGIVAKLDTSALTGFKSINLIGGDMRSGLVPVGSVLPAGASAMDEITSKAAEIVSQMAVIAGQLSSWTSDENRLRMERLLEGLDLFSRGSQRFLANTEKPIIEALRSLTITSGAVTEIARVGTGLLKDTQSEINTTLRTLRRPLEKVDPQYVAAIVKDAHSLMEELEKKVSLADLGGSLSSMTETLKRADRLILDLDLLVTAGRQDFTMMLAQLREATEDLREFSRIIAQDPSLLLRGTSVGP